MARNRTSRKIVINFRLSVTRKSNKRGGRTKQKHDNMDDDSVYWTIIYRMCYWLLQQLCKHFFCINRLVNSYHKAKNTVHREDENSVLMFSFFLLLFMLSVDTFVFFPSMLRCFLVCCLSSLLSSGEKCSRPEYFKRKET